MVKLTSASLPNSYSLPWIAAIQGNKLSVLREVVIGGLTAWMGGNTCGVDYIMSNLWLSEQHSTEKDDHTDVRMI